LLVTAISDRSESFLFCELARRGHRITLVCSPDEPQIEAYRAAGINIVPFTISSRISPRAVRKLRRLIIDRDIESVYATFNKGLAAVTLAATGISCRRYAYRGTLGNLSRFNPTAYLTHLSPSLSGIVCNCRAIKEDLVRFGLPEEKLTTVYKGHDPEWYEVDSKEDLASYFEQPFAVRPAICCVANMRPQKGGDVLLYALSMIPEERRPNLVFVGRNNHPSLVGLTKKLGLQAQVRFLGYRQDAYSIVASSTISVMPSLGREGVPRSIAESIFVETAVVVSDVGGLPEIVSDHAGGLVIPAGDAAALSRAILELVEDSDLRAKYAQYAKEKLKQQLNLKDYVDSMEKVLAN